MATRRQATKVGAFLLAVGVIALAVMAALSGLSLERPVTYRIRFTQNVTGLTNGAKVLFKGVECGRVVDMSVDQQGMVVVWIEIRPRAIPPLREGVRARLDLAGVSGLLYVTLSGGDPKNERLEPGDWIPSDPSILDQLVSDWPQLTANLQAALRQISDVVSGVDPEDVRLLVRDTRQLLATVSRSAASVITAATRALDNYSRLAQRLEGELPAALRAVASAAVTAETRVNEISRMTAELLPEVRAALRTGTQSWQSTMDTSRAAIAEASVALARLDLDAIGPVIRSTLAEMERTLSDVSHVIQNVGRTSDVVQAEVVLLGKETRSTLQALQGTLQAIERLVDYLERDPGAVLRGKAAPDSTRGGRR